MNEEYYRYAKRELSELNEMRNKFWQRLRAFRNRLLKMPDFNHKDKHCKELYALVNDLWESAFIEEIRRQKGLKPTCIEKSKKRDKDRLEIERDLLPTRDGKGLYAANLLCSICALPLAGRQKLYCSDFCRNKAKSRNWRKYNPEKKQESNYQYLKKYVHPYVKKIK